ncbi:MAG: zinc-binding dehydrogenase, partial [Gammaproteobacteria bacterium]|nr:zinc-binding dehydrogenase [Gammaproteobacteria bacterium]
MELFDEKMNPLAIIENLRYRAVKLVDKKQHLSYLDYHLIPAPRVNKGIPVLAEKIHSVLSKSFYAYAENQKLYQNEFLPLIDSLVHLAITEQFIQLKENDPQRLDELASEYIEKSETLDSRRYHVFDYAVNQGLISLDDQQLIVEEEHSHGGEISSELIWNTLIREYPDYFEETHLVGSFMLEIGSLFSTNDSFTKQVEYSEVFDRYFKAQHGRYCLKSLQNIVKTIREIQAEIAPGERFSICEIAQSRAYLAPSVIPELDFNQCDFTFLSPNESSVNHFNETHHHYPLATAKIISETGDNTQTEINHAGFQLAVITLDTHDIQSLVSSLKLLTQHLCENATILISGISSQSWHRLVFEPAQVNLNNNVCLSLLKQSGFTDIKTITSDIDIEDLFILSSKWSKRTLVDSGSQENCNNEDNGYCLFLGTAQPDEKLIKSSFDKYRASHTFLSIDSLYKFKNTLHSLSNENGKITHIIYANGLGYSTEPFKQQSLRCSELSELHQLLDSSSQQPLVTILTRNVADMYRQSSIEPPIEQRLPADAALWGFGRTLMNEASSYSLRLIDLPEDLNLAVLNQLNEEIFHSTLESEIFIDTRGDRFAPRLRLEKHPFYKLEKHPFYKKALADNSRSQTSLQFDIPGQLKNLVWKSTDSPDPGPDQVEVEIKATGLNFRDVMYALGLLSDEAIENGFAGASLGLEFSGRIIATGRNVKRFNINDRVVGFNSSCFSDRMVCTPDTLVKIPFGMSYSSAATIPTTFLTVYYSLKHLARIQPGERVLIHGAAGGVGLAAIQIAQWLGAEIYATVGSKDKRDFLTLLGVKNIYNSRDLTFADKILHDTGDNKGVDAVLNSLAGEAINLNLKVLRPFGRFLELGKRDFYENTPIGLRPFRNNISYFGIDADQLQKD